MFISFDNGAHWQPFQLNLPQVPITDIKVHRKDLVVSTQGRAFWILDNLTALHQLTSQTTLARTVGCSSRATVIARASAPHVLGPNDRVLPAVWPAGPVTIDIVDATGSVVTRTAAMRRPPVVDEVDEAGAAEPRRLECATIPRWRRADGRPRARRRRAARHESRQA